jgi:hypothetical protein
MDLTDGQPIELINWPADRSTGRQVAKLAKGRLMASSPTIVLAGSFWVSRNILVSAILVGIFDQPVKTLKNLNS